MVADDVGGLIENDQVVVQSTEIGELLNIEIHPDVK